MPTFSDARDGREVVLDDGRTGRLQHITRRSRIATVVMGGRRYRLPASEVTVISTHRPPVDGVLPCCGESIGVISPDDMISDNLSAVTCPGPVV